MGLIDCPAIVQPDPLTSLPNEWCAKQGNAAPFHLTRLLTNGQQAQESVESIKIQLACWSDRFLINLGHNRPNFVIWLLYSDGHISKFQKPILFQITHSKFKNDQNKKDFRQKLD